MTTLERNNVMQVHMLEANSEQLKGIWAKYDSLDKLQRSESKPK